MTDRPAHAAAPVFDGALTPEMLNFAPPQFAVETLRPQVAAAFGVDGDYRRLDGERDQNFRIETEGGARFVLKISAATEDPAVVDLQVQALRHLERTAPDLPAPRVIRAGDRRAVIDIEAESGVRHQLRLLSYLDGAPLNEGAPLTAASLVEIGAFQGRLARALRGFFHPAARHFMAWDVTNGLLFNEALIRLETPRMRAVADPIRARLSAETFQRLGRLRAQVIHHDAHERNLLRDPAGGDRITGVIDFGDMIHAPLALELAPSLASIVEKAPDPTDAAVALVAGFHGASPLEAEDIDVILDLTLARLILTLQLFQLRLSGATPPPDFVAADMPAIEAALERLAAIDPTSFADRLRDGCGLPTARPPQRRDDAALLERRERTLGPSYQLFYQRPAHLVRGAGVWLTDADGRDYLDCYNNVPSVGHCHPHVVAALSRQSRRLNTHTRYLHETVIDYAETLAAKLPGDLSICLLTCTGTEANDLAFRIARAVSGQRGAIVVDGAYHGNSTTVTELSTCEYPPEERPDYLEAIAAPDLYRGRFGADHNDAGAAYAQQVDGAIAALESRGQAPAMFLCDASFDSNGIYPAPAGYLPEVYARVRAAGGLCVADEVQSGLCRMGRHWWGFEDSGVVPDIVTMGKPMGDGHPLGVVVTTPEIAAVFSRKFSYFNTFGGNPVSAAVGLAVLEVVERENILASAGAVGAHLAKGFAALKERHALIGDARGQGLFWGIELVRDRQTQEPADDEAAEVVERMREDGVLIARCGPLRNVLKFRPPLVFQRQHADIALAALDRALASL